MPGRYDIYVFDEDGVFYTRPAVAMVEGGKEKKKLMVEGGKDKKKLKVRNLTGRSITLTFPKRVLLGATLLTVGPHKKGQADIDPNADGIFDYQVQVSLTRKIQTAALGNSWPKIIVDP
jgi:hypothetical protein